MDTIEDFKQIIEGQYGINDLKSYGEYKFNVTKRGLSRDEVDKLSPDNVNSSSFWEYIEKNPEIKNDAICFGISKDGTRDEVNRHNFGLACSMNSLCPILLYRDCVGMPILDIGPGYGMLKEFVEKNTKLKYFGVDVYPKVEGVLQVSSDGSTLPSEITSMTGRFGLVMSINVFQHLSVKQRRHYYKQIYDLLHPTHGIFVFTVCCQEVNAAMKGFFCAETGKEYMCHYGQYTEMQSYSETVDDLNKHFNILSLCQRSDNQFTFQCMKKNESSTKGYFGYET
jgi:hypothetical protein